MESVIVVEDGDYPDAIDVAAVIANVPGFRPEGGVRNVARRDGLGTVLPAAFEEMGCLPLYYFQAIGSGTGAIAVLESAKRLLRASGGIQIPKMMLCQNQPFTLIHDAWKSGTADPRWCPSGSSRDAITKVMADELTNWRPPYAITGGLYDCLVESRGDVLTTSNASVQAAIEMFAELEGIDIEPAAGVALACLVDYTRQERIQREAVVLLNVTGGGRIRLSRDYELIEAEPRLRLRRESLARSSKGELVSRVLGAISGT